MPEAACYQVLTTTATKEEAALVADALLEKRLAACVQVAGPLESRYWWQGRLELAAEWLCVAKTTEDRLEEVVATIRLTHSYDTPEVTATRIAYGDRSYLEWIAEEVHQRGPQS
ncbi:MAG: divalent-cation tolerance protein CutA [Actinomycetota bacterium]|nr:divalent-cation tolerance protein CutA [Actinomycetota bacterium]